MVGIIHTIIILYQMGVLLFADKHQEIYCHQHRPCNYHKMTCNPQISQCWQLTIMRESKFSIQRINNVNQLLHGTCLVLSNAPIENINRGIIVKILYTCDLGPGTLLVVTLGSLWPPSRLSKSFKKRNNDNHCQEAL